MKVVKEQILANKIEVIKGFIYQSTIRLNDWKTRTGIYEGPEKYRMDSEEWLEMPIGTHWEAKDNFTCWLKTEIRIPEEFDGKKVVLDIDVGGEALVYINGTIRSALTSYLQPQGASRSRVLVADKAKGGTVLDIVIEAGLNYMEFARFRAKGATSVMYQFKRALLAAVDPKVESYYFDTLVTYEVLRVLSGSPFHELPLPARLPRDIEEIISFLSKGSASALHDRVLDALEASLAAVDVDFDRESLVASLDEGQRILWEKLDAIEYSPEATVVLTGHSHIDTAWLWPIKETIRKCARTFSNMLALMEEYPEHHFVASQPQLFEYTKTHYPELYDKIKERVKEGRWELIGNSWVENDTNVPSGEAMVRQILYGRNFFKEEFGKWSKILWMPDVFGYSWALPQIIKRSGMEFFMTSKLLNNDTNKFPHTLFWWQGIDGTKIIAYLQQVSYNGVITPSYISHAWTRFNEKECFNEAMGTYGYGDGGGGPNYEMLEYSKRLKNFPGLPSARIGSAESFFEDAAEKAENLPVWNNEMYYEMHRGTYTTQAHNKRNNRKSELLYREAEMASSLAGIYGFAYPKEELTHGWKQILLNQFHDIIPGSSIHEVYEDCKIDYAEIFSIGNQAEQKALKAMASKVQKNGAGNSITVFNFLSWDRTGVVEAELPTVSDNFALVDAEGKALPYTLKIGEKSATISFEAVNVPSMGYASYSLVDLKEKRGVSSDISVTASCMENRFYRMELDKEGRLTSIYDKTAGREVLSENKYGNLLQIFEDKPERQDAWNIDVEYQNKSWEVNNVKSIEIVEEGPVKGVLRIVKAFNQSEITQDIILYHSIPRIDFDTHVDWHEDQKMLKAAFEVDVLSPKAAYEIAFGTIERPTHWNTSWDRARFEVSAHKWADLSEGGFGVGLLNDCKYGYDIKDNVMRITLLRATTYPDPVADRGQHHFIYSLYPHTGDWIQGDVVHAGYDLNVPLKAAVGEKGREGDLPAAMSFMSINCPNVIIDTLKEAEDGKGIILRVYESQGKRGTAAVRTVLPVTGAMECNLMEEDESAVLVKDGGFEFYIKPYEIKTFRLIG